MILTDVSVFEASWSVNIKADRTNYAEAIQELLLRLEGELGARGSGRE